MNIPELKSDLEVIKLMIKHYEERGGGYSQKTALQNVLSACQLLCDTSDKMLPKKEGSTDRGDYTGNSDDDYENGVSNGEIWGYNLAREEDILWLTKKLMGLENFIKDFVYRWNGSERMLTTDNEGFKQLANAIIQSFGLKKEG